MTVLALLLAALAAGDPPPVGDVVDRFDTLYRSESSRASMEMEIETEHWSRTLSMDVWTLGMEKTLIRITAPARERGTATLRVGDDMWNYLPGTNSVMRIPPSMMMGSWMGSHFTNDDLVRETSYREDYDFSYTEWAEPQEGRLHVEMTPHEDAPVVWGRLVMAVRSDDLLPVWIRYYDEDGGLQRTMRFSDYRQMGGRLIPAEMSIEPADEEGSTVVRYEEAEFGVDLDDDLFTLRSLRSGGS
jgi:outer membrane lipoprotein-sorting protein